MRNAPWSQCCRLLKVLLSRFSSEVDVVYLGEVVHHKFQAHHYSGKFYFWCKNEILEIELLSKIIYKPPCSPSADLCCSMLCLVSGCNLVASKVSFICITSITSKQWSFSGSEGQLTETGSQGRTFLSQKTSGSFGAVKNAADTESAGGYSVILILVYVSASLRFRFLTWLEIVCCRLGESSPSVDDIFRQAKHWSIKNKRTTHML